MSKTLWAKYFQEHEERLQKKLAKDIKNLIKKKKKKKWQFGHERYKNLSEHEKQKLVESRKKYYRMRKKCYIIIIRSYFDLEKIASL